MPAHCVKEAATALGFHLADLRRELGLFSSHPPAALQRHIRTLESALARLVNGSAASDDVRAAACSAFSLVGARIEFDAKEGQALLDALKPERLGPQSFSAGACVLNANQVRLRDSDSRAWLDELRQRLRALVVAPTVAGHEGDNLRRIRMAALNGLQRLGLAPEHEFVLSLYRQLPETGPLAEMVHRHMDEVSADRLATPLIECGANEALPAAERAHCLRGILHLKRNFDGDDGSALRVIALAVKSEGEVRTAACTVLQAFRDRDGLVMRRRGDHDPDLIKACPKPIRDEQAPDLDARLEELMRKLGQGSDRSG